MVCSEDVPEEVEGAGLGVLLGSVPNAGLTLLSAGCRVSVSESVPSRKTRMHAKFEVNHHEGSIAVAFTAIIQ